MPGPPPKPTALKLLEGNPGKRALNTEEPKPEALTTDEPPEFVAGDVVALAEWRRVLPIVQAMRVMTEADRGALAEMCMTFARLRQAEAEVDSEGLTVTGAMGGTVKNPCVTIMDDQRKILLAFQREFGLVPGARSRVKVSTPAPVQTESAWDRLKKPRSA